MSSSVWKPGETGAIMIDQSSKSERAFVLKPWANINNLLLARSSKIFQSERKGIFWFVMFGASAQIINMDKYAPFSMVSPAKSKFNFHVVPDGSYKVTCRQTELLNISLKAHFIS